MSESVATLSRIAAIRYLRDRLGPETTLGVALDLLHAADRDAMQLYGHTIDRLSLDLHFLDEADVVEDPLQAPIRGSRLDEYLSISDQQSLDRVCDQYANT